MVIVRRGDFFIDISRSSCVSLDILNAVEQLKDNNDEVIQAEKP